MAFCPACAWQPAFILSAVFGEEIKGSPQVPGSTAPHPAPGLCIPALNLPGLSCQKGFGCSWTPITPVLFPGKNCSVGSLQSPSCTSPAQLLIFCWWGTTHSCLSGCLRRNEGIYDLLPYSSSTSTVFLPPHHCLSRTGRSEV